jgi:L-fuconolactonase
MPPFETPFEIVDAYCHCGPDWGAMEEWRKPKVPNQPIEFLRKVMASIGVSRTVVAQHHGGDNDYILKIIKEEPWKFAGLFRLQHDTPTPERELELHASNGLFRGTRAFEEVWHEAPHLVGVAARLGFVIMNSGGTIEQLRALLGENPECELVLLHFGGGRPEQTESVITLAEWPNVYVQISGFGLMDRKYPYSEIYPTIEKLVAAFGPSRLMWGSDYPVGDAYWAATHPIVELPEQVYKEDLALLLEGKLPVPRDAIPDIAGGNARALYFDPKPRK